MESRPRTVAVRGQRALLTPHPPEGYPGVRVLRLGSWKEGLILPEVGQTIVALGGETARAYETVDGGRAEGFVLRPDDRATLLARDLPFCFAEWRIERS